MADITDACKGDVNETTSIALIQILACMIPKQKEYVIAGSIVITVIVSSEKGNSMSKL